ncbi:MAG: Asp-tRNA(Asn)/Glu-tRNA(Gln) amidotransferase subunit GatC [Clostridia bacterium]|nr:Asp-tRNA(Asn)/Glu-tRNA(Gln) amidotransferase subunit GatC [Clostridia bacterium]
MEITELKGLEEVNQLKFNSEESEKVLNVFAEMEKREQKLSKIDTQNQESVVYVMPIYNVLREDERVQDFSREDLLKNAPQASEDSWQVPRLVK